GPTPFWLIQLEFKADKWTGKVLDSGPGVVAATLENVQATKEHLHIQLKIQGQLIRFDGKIAREAKDKIQGTLDNNKELSLAQLDRTVLTSLKDPYEVNKEILAKNDGPEVFDAAVAMLQQASEKKVKPEEVRSIADRAFKTADRYGTRWQKEIALRIADVLAQQESQVKSGVEYARLAERLLEPGDDAQLQIRVLEVLANALLKSGKADETKDLMARIETLEKKADDEYAKRIPPLATEPFAGRKKKSDRAVLIELFTGAQCLPCVAADVAFDAVAKTYKSTEVILLEYHLHIPGPDPLSNSDCEARMDYYGPAVVEGTPTILFNGKPGATGGGSLDVARSKYKEYRAVIDPLVETPAKVKLKVGTVRQKDKIDAMVEVSDLEGPAENLFLRLALVENQVRYVGGNQVRFHHQVVRAFPGGAKGFELKSKNLKQSVHVDLGDLRKALAKYLEDFNKTNPFPNAKRPLDLKQLSIVAFVQNDKTKEILQAAQVEVME
ncbi:MAG TPA: hypothetical protein VGY77_01330, partial [Gemmataceae bacterium]|nr:hypothetical protein [Gemmataceae bacterium]